MNQGYFLPNLWKYVIMSLIYLVFDPCRPQNSSLLWEDESFLCNIFLISRAVQIHPFISWLMRKTMKHMYSCNFEHWRWSCIESELAVVNWTDEEHQSNIQEAARGNRFLSRPSVQDFLQNPNLCQKAANHSVYSGCVFWTCILDEGPWHHAGPTCTS